MAGNNDVETSKTDGRKRVSGVLYREVIRWEGQSHLKAKNARRKLRHQGKKERKKEKEGESHGRDPANRRMRAPGNVRAEFNQSYRQQSMNFNLTRPTRDLEGWFINS